jgi:hypothetical protein
VTTVYDEGVAIPFDALQNNSSLKTRFKRWNDDLTNLGKKLVNDVSSTKETLQSNHSLREIYCCVEDTEEIQQHSKYAVRVNITISCKL